MSQRDIRHWLWDIRASCDLILHATQGLTYEQFVADRFRRSGVEREFEIAAEALKRTLALEPGLSLRFPQARGIIDFRNILAHGYHVVNYEKVWPIILHDVPVLRKTADDILHERPPHTP